MLFVTSSPGEQSCSEGLKPPPSVADLPAVDGQRGDLGDVHEALAAKLLESGLRLDSATLAAAAAGLKDTSILEKQLRRAREVCQ